MGGEGLSVEEAGTRSGRGHSSGDSLADHLRFGGTPSASLSLDRQLEVVGQVDGGLVSHASYGTSGGSPRGRSRRAWPVSPGSASRIGELLILVRHGQTAANAAGLLLGRADPPLTELGRRQAEALAAALRSPVRVIASPLARARETAEAFGRPVEVDERWIEMDYGSLDGLAVSAVAAEVWERWRADATFVPGGGESLAAVGIRVRAACDELAEEASERDIAVVTHVSPIKAAIAWALGVGEEVVWRLFVEDASVARVATSPPIPVLRSFNERHPPG